MRRSTVLSLVVLILAIAAWAGVWFLFSDISSKLDARSQEALSSGQQSAVQTSAIEAHALVADTADERGALDSSVNTQVVDIANVITGAGKAAGTQTMIGSASVVGSAGANSGVNQLEFIVQSSGTFAQVWRAAQLYETLPLPSSVSEVDLEQVPNADKSSTWQLTAHIDVLTSAQISS